MSSEVLEVYEKFVDQTDLLPLLRELIEPESYVCSENEAQIINSLKTSTDDIYLLDDGKFSQTFFSKIANDFNVSVIFDKQAIKLIRKNLEEQDKTYVFVRSGLLINLEEIIIHKKFLTQAFEKELKTEFKVRIEEINDSYVRIVKLKNKTIFLYNNKEIKCT
jgi:hypothetical protein